MAASAPPAKAAACTAPPVAAPHHHATARVTSRTNLSPARYHAKQEAPEGNVFGYSPPPEEPNMLSRDVWRWVQVCAGCRCALGAGVSQRTHCARDVSACPPCNACPACMCVLAACSG
jgi:hypothetical protein